ncbi:MAG: hypothetical protein QXL15_03890 [Candidatus Korarchaeota archaeon]
MPKKTYAKKRIIFHWKYGRMHLVLLVAMLSSIAQTIVAYLFDLLRIAGGLMVVMTLTGAALLSQVEFSLDLGELIYHKFSQISQKTLYIISSVTIALGIIVEFGSFIATNDLVIGIGISAISLVVASLVVRTILHLKYKS